MQHAVTLASANAAVIEPQRSKDVSSSIVSAEVLPVNVAIGPEVERGDVADECYKVAEVTGEGIGGIGRGEGEEAQTLIGMGLDTAHDGVVETATLATFGGAVGVPCPTVIRAPFIAGAVLNSNIK